MDPIHVRLRCSGEARNFFPEKKQGEGLWTEVPGGILSRVKSPVGEDPHLFIQKPTTFRKNDWWHLYVDNIILHITESII